MERGFRLSPNGLKTSFSQIETVASVHADHDNQVVVSDSDSKADKKFKESSGFFYTTPAFFEIFNFPLLAGSYESLKNPNNVLLTKETADKYYGDWKTAIGKTFKLDNTDVVKVSGILASVPVNTQFR